MTPEEQAKVKPNECEHKNVKDITWHRHGRQGVCGDCGKKVYMILRNRNPVRTKPHGSKKQRRHDRKEKSSTGDAT